MKQIQHPAHPQVVKRVSESAYGSWLEAGWLPVASLRESMTNAELIAEIESRNEGRDDDSLIVAESKKKVDLIAALDQNDAAAH